MQMDGWMDGEYLIGIKIQTLDETVGREVYQGVQYLKLHVSESKWIEGLRFALWNYGLSAQENTNVCFLYVCVRERVCV